MLEVIETDTCVLAVPMTFIQVGFAAGLSNSIVYEIMQHFINFVSVVCVAFATSKSYPYLFPSPLLSPS
jgi:hypothetical protein